MSINPFVNFIYRDRLYFSIDIVGGGTSPKLYGLWSLGRSKETGQYSLTIERGATTGDTETSILAAAAIGDIYTTVHTANGTITTTNTATAFADIYAGTNYLETQVHNEGDSSVTKKLYGVTVMFEPLIASASVTLKYRVDAAINNESTGWTTIFTTGTDNKISHSAINIESSGANLGEFKELQLRIESTGGAIITGYKFKAEVISKDLYD